VSITRFFSLFDLSRKLGNVLEVLNISDAFKPLDNPWLALSIKQLMVSHWHSSSADLSVPVVENRKLLSQDKQMDIHWQPGGEKAILKEYVSVAEVVKVGAIHGFLYKCNCWLTLFNRLAPLS
jgi:hypothetical protein